jgi:acyl-CoA synthetase (AMP-forming)/AMP-acid ligase II
MNTTDFLEVATAICPERTFIVFEKERYTFGQVADRVNRLAGALQKLGVNKGDRVAVFEVNCNEYVETYYAAAKLGAVLVPLNYRAREEELEYLLGHSQPSVLMVGSRYLSLVDAVVPKLPFKLTCIAIDIDAKPKNMLSYDTLIASSSGEFTPAEVDEEDMTVLMYTAGTTGRPKGVGLRHRNFTAYVLAEVDPVDPDKEERNLLCLPLYHIAGFQGMLTATYGGRTLVMMRQFEVKDWLEAVPREKVNRCLLVPTMLKQIVDDPDFAKYDLSSMQVITYGAAAMPFPVIEKAIHLLPKVRFSNAFGQTETAATLTVLGPEDHVIGGTPEEQEKKLARLKHSIGQPLPSVEIKVLDSEGKEAPPRQVGEIVAKGPMIMGGYWGDAQKTAQVLDEKGYLHTGDMGWKDEEGYVFLSGRGDDLIKRAGEQISPEEVENVLHCHPKVKEVAIIGIPDLEWGQIPRAIVVIKQGEACTEEELMEFCRQKLASFKRPRSVVFVDSLPRSNLGKVLRKVCREKWGKA